MSDLLTDDERLLITDLGQFWVRYCAIVGNGPSRAGDLREAVHHIHALQHAVMSQAAARAYPKDFRLLGAPLLDNPLS